MVTTPERFGRYRVTGTLGAGAMGAVYLAVDDVLGREVAIKTLRAGAAGGMAARIVDERFRTEARAIAQLAHPAVVQVFDLDPAADPPYLVMERVAGPSLKERLAGGVRLGAGEVRALGIQIANALAAAHAANIVHRDVKPANILAAGDGAWKLADFGVAHVPDSGLTMTGQFVGSPAYAPVEALVQGASLPAGDVYGLGAVLYQAAAGTWPRLDSTSGALLAPIPPIATVAPGIDAELAHAIDRAVALEATERPTAAELAQLLASAPRMSAAIAAPVVAAAPWRRYAIAGAIVVIGAVIAIVASRGRGHGDVAVDAARPSVRDLLDDAMPAASPIDDLGARPDQGPPPGPPPIEDRPPGHGPPGKGHGKKPDKHKHGPAGDD